MRKKLKWDGEEDQIWYRNSAPISPIRQSTPIEHPERLRTLGSGAPKYILDRWMLMVMSVFFEEEDGGA